jgi:uncharacterized membrane protein
VSARAEFLTTLKAGLRGVPADTIDEIVADYSAHFDEGAAANRNDADIAAALGDPLALADELRMELRIKSFEAAPSTRTAARVIAGTIAVGALNTVLLCIAGPLLALLALAVAITIVVCAATGMWFLYSGASLDLPGGTGVPVLAGLGLISAAVSLAAFFALAARAAGYCMARYTRLRYRILPRASSTGAQT